MVKEIDKTRIKNWAVGDTFAWKIKSSKYPKYNNRYILFTMIETPKTWELLKTERAFISKITPNCTLPQNQSEYENAESIKLTFWDPDFLSNLLYEVKYDAKPDEYDYVYGYVFKFWLTNYKVSSDMIYIGNFNFNQPTDSYIPDNPLCGLRLILFNNSFDTEIDDTLERYEINNLRKGVKYSEEYLKNRDKIRQDNIDFMNHLRKVSEEIEKKCEIYGCDTKKHRDTCTYVGHKKNKK